MPTMHNPAHPGEVLLEYLPESVGISEAAKRLGVTRQALSAIVNGRAGISAEMALRLEATLNQDRTPHEQPIELAPRHPQPSDGHRGARAPRPVLPDPRFD
jgi:addiction module HigA family antidote